MMVKQALQERRNAPRAKRILSIQFRRVEPKTSDDTWYLSTTQDMSIGGLSFYTDQEYRAKDILEINVAMSGVLDIFNGFARVVRSERKKTGVYFLIAVELIEGESYRRNAKSYLKKGKSKNRLKTC